MSRVLGVDYGTKRVGLSISDPERTMAVAKGLIDNHADEKLVDEILAIVDESEIGQLVFGLPLHLSGDESASSMRVREFADMVKAKRDIAIGFQDERFTTIQSAQPLLLEKKKYRQQKGARDQGAAVLILQAWLDKQGK